MPKIISIDFGLKRVGLAEADSIAFPLEAITYNEYTKLLELLTSLIKANSYEKILIGLPLGYDEKETEMSKKVRLFSEDLEESLGEGYEIIFWNEVLTSELAKQNLQGMKKSIDSESARIILQEYLDFQNEKQREQTNKEEAR